MSFSELLANLLSDDGYVVDEYAGKWRLRRIVDGTVVNSKVYETRGQAVEAADGPVKVL